MKIFFHTITLAFISLISTTLSASNPADWKTYFENDSIKIEFTYQNCEYTEQFNSEFVIFRISNLTNISKTLKWNQQLWHDNICSNCEHENTEFRTNQIIKPKEILQGDCGPYNQLRIFVKFTEELENMPGIIKIDVLTRFELTNLTIH